MSKKNNSIKFKKGILGFPEEMDFIFAQMEDKIDDYHFWAMIETNRDSDPLDFTVLPMENAFAKNLISFSDVKKSIEKELDLDMENTTAFLIVKASNDDGILSIYVNLQAPIVIDLEKQEGVQILLDEKYPLSEKIIEINLEQNISKQNLR